MHGERDAWIDVCCGEQSEAHDERMWWLCGISCRVRWIGPRPAKLPRNDDADRKRLSKSLPVPLNDQHVITDEAAAPSDARMMLEPYNCVLLDMKYESLRIAMDVVVE